ncbi:MAG: 23S rRNA (cytosine(1962)-C(5))-methyltransferase RlmI, partial [Anaerolineales bacterium]
MSKEARLILKEGREKPILQRHPWIFSGAIMDLEGDPGPGETILIADRQGKFLARGAFSPQSQIRVRIWSWDEEEQIGPAFFKSRIREAITYREVIGYNYPMRRLIHAESDRFPGLIVDQYGDYLVVQLLSAGVEAWKAEIIQALVDLTGAKGVYERSDVE